MLINYIMLKYYLPFVVSYSIFSFLFFLLDVFSYKFKVLKKLKIDDITYEQLLEIYIKIFPNVFMNLYIYSIPMTFIVDRYYVKYNDLEPITVIVDLYLTYILSQISFYWFHRLFHIPRLYKYHKKHHEIKIPVGMAAIYTHWLDFYGNMFAIGIVPVLIGVNPIILNIWLVFSAFNTIVSHSNLKKVKQHDIHHKLFNYNYGAFWLDKLYNTLKIEHQD
jgi:sterol desaturase/sphingolipid hydroxylase (fatty acid hydroxylase superfamily)